MFDPPLFHGHLLLGDVEVWEPEKVVPEGGIRVLGFTVLVIIEIGFSVFALKMSGFLVFLFVVVFGFFLFKHPVFGFYENEKRFFGAGSVSLPGFQTFLVHVVRRHPGDVPGESGQQKAVEVFRNFIAIALK